jgi:nitrate reductase molybdenum cofactor assembly chaperone NarJ/NarW
MSRALRALAALLAYPDEALLEALPEIRCVVPKAALPLLAELEGKDLYPLQECYVALFDRSRALSLHLFEHVHGESRERGQAMVDLQAMYGARGFGVADHELPDFIPAFLEFVSLLDSRDAGKLLGETAQIFRAIGDRLAERASPYASVFAALLELAGEAGLTKKAAGTAAKEENLDAQWMDPEVTFGGSKPAVAPMQFYRNGVPA